MAARAACRRSTACALSRTGWAGSPLESSMDRPATPVSSARLTLSKTASGVAPKPLSKSALIGRSLMAAM